MSNQATPLATDVYSRTMAEAFDERAIVSVPTGFQAYFGNPASGSQTIFNPNSAVIEIDILRGNERLAATIQRGIETRPIKGQKNTKEQLFTSFSRVYPLIEEEGDIGADQLIKRLAGEGPYQGRERLDRLRILGMNHHKEQVRRSVRTFEFLASQSILLGTMPAIIGTTNTDFIYDFYRKSTHIAAVSVGWNQTTSDIAGDLDTACDLIRADAHVTADMVLIGGTAMEALINDSDTQTVADNRRFELIQVSTNNPVPPRFQRFVDAGFVARGRFRTPKGYELWLFTYVDVYTDSAGTATKYMPEDKAVVSFSGARCDRYFGPSEVLPMTAQRAAWYQEMFGFNPLAAPMPPNIKNSGQAVSPAMFYFDAYPSANFKHVTIRSQAAPIFATTMTDAFMVLTGLVT